MVTRAVIGTWRIWHTTSILLDGARSDHIISRGYDQKVRWSLILLAVPAPTQTAESSKLIQSCVWLGCTFQRSDTPTHVTTRYNSDIEPAPGVKDYVTFPAGFTPRWSGYLLPLGQETSLSLEIGSIWLRHTTIRYTMNNADVESLEIVNSVRRDHCRQWSFPRIERHQLASVHATERPPSSTRG